MLGYLLFARYWFIVACFGNVGLGRREEKLGYDELVLKLGKNCDNLKENNTHIQTMSAKV